MSKYKLGYVDYVVVGLSLLVPTCIGILVRFVGGRQSTTLEYWMAGRNMAKFPVVFSIVATTLSGIAMLGFPAESYKYGSALILLSVFWPLGVALGAYIFIPVYFQCNVSTIYEFLGMRYGKLTRHAVAACFVLQMILYMSTALYAPVLALTAVTSLSFELSIILVGSICTFYCCIGGLKAVLWTDVFQASLMFICMAAIYVAGIQDSGGITEVYHRAESSGRLNMFDMRLDLVTRYTFWNAIARGFSVSLGACATSQIEMQRILSLSKCRRAQSVAFWSCIPLFLLLVMTCGFGLILNGLFHDCDPVLDQEHTGVTRYDQLVPYYIVKRFGSTPGLTGLCVAGIFSGALSSLSSALNAASSVTVVDLVQPFSPSTKTSDSRSVFMTKALALLYGGIVIGLTFIFSKIDSILHVMIVLYSIVEGPVLGIFLVGVLYTKGNDKVASVCFFTGVIVTGYVGFYTLFGGYRYPTLTMNTDSCVDPSNRNGSLANSSAWLNASRAVTNVHFSHNSTSYNLNENIYRPSFSLKKISHFWISALSSFFTVGLMLVFTCFPGLNQKVIQTDSMCLSPIARFWSRKRCTKDQINRNNLAKCTKAESNPLEAASLLTESAL